MPTKRLRRSRPIRANLSGDRDSQSRSFKRRTRSERNSEPEVLSFSASSLRQKRQSMKVVSDEALIDLDDYTVMLLPNENKPDVTECFERVRHLIDASVDLRLVSGTGRVHYLIVVTTATCSPGCHPCPLLST